LILGNAKAAISLSVGTMISGDTDNGLHQKLAERGRRWCVYIQFLRHKTLLQKWFIKIDAILQIVLAGRS